MKFPALVCAFAFVSTAAADPTPATRAAHWTVRVKTKDGLIPVGEITRAADGKVTTKALAAPALDKLGDAVAAEWKAYKPAAAIPITQTIASDTGMHPAWKPHEVTFTPSDVLYWPAAIKVFGDKHHYDILGIDHLKFVDYDSSGEEPRGADDRSSTHSNFRKNTEWERDAGEYTIFFVRKRIRPSGMGTPSGVLRVSASDPQLAVEQDNDDGLLDIAWIKLFKDNHLEVVPQHAADAVARLLEATVKPMDVDVNIIEHATDYKTLHVAATSPKFVEAAIVEFLEHGNFYDVTPAIDPAMFR